MLIRRFPIVIALLLLSACASSPSEDQAQQLPKRTYLDANLGLTLSLPADWEHKSIVPPLGSPAAYSVLWTAPKNQGSISLQVSVLPAGDLTPTATAAIDNFTRTHPGFTLTARRLDSSGPWHVETALGHSSRLNYRLLHIDAGEHIFQIAFAAPPEAFQRYDRLFDEIFESFLPLP